MWPFLLVLVAAGAFSFWAAYVRRWVGGRVSLDVQYDLRVAIFERLQRLDFGTTTSCRPDSSCRARRRTSG